MAEQPLPPKIFDHRSAGRRGQFLINLLYILTLVALAGAAIWLASKWLLPFLLAFATAALLQRPVGWLTKRTSAPLGFLSGALVVALVLLFATAVGSVGWWLWRTLVVLFSNEQALTGLVDTLTGAAATLESKLMEWGARLSPETQAALAAAFGNVLSESEAWLGNWVGTAARGLLNFTVTRLPNLLFGFVIWVIASVFFTVDYRRITTFLFQQLPAPRREMAKDIRLLFSGSVRQLIRAYLLLMAITFVELAIGLLLLHIPNAPLIAAIIALVDLMPVLGVGSVLIPWAGIAFLNGTPRTALWLLILYLVITLVRNAVEPRLVGERVGLPPVVSLLCLYLGWKIAGIAGVILLPIAATILLQLHKRGHLSLWK